MAIGDGNLIAYLVGDLERALLGGSRLVTGLLERMRGDHRGHHRDDLLAAERSRLTGRSDEAGHAFGLAHDAAGVLIGYMRMST